MEFSLTNGYRLLTEDITLMYDMYMLCKNSRYYKRDGKTQYRSIFRDYFNLLKYVIHEESLDDAKLNYHINTGNNDYIPRSNDYSSTYLYDTHIEGTGKRTRSGSNAPAPLIREMDQLHAKQTILLLAWYYMRTVILQFLVEEASQYPFWSSKVSVVLSDEIFHLCNPKNLFLGFWSPTGYPGNDVSLPRLWFSALKLRWENGLWEGILPYLGAISCMNLHTLINWSQKFTLRSVVPYIYGRGHLTHSDSVDVGESFLQKTPDSSKDDLLMVDDIDDDNTTNTISKSFAHNDSMSNIAILKRNTEMNSAANDITTTDVEGSTAGDLGDESLDHGTIEVLDVGKVETEIKSKSSLFGMFGNKTKSKELKTSEPDITKEREIPEVKGAYFRKMGHFIPSMKKRYIQLEAGMLIYYVDDTLAQKKSSIDLADCYVADDIKKVLDHQIYIAPLRCKPPSSERANGKDLLLEMLDEMNILPNMKEEWVSAIEKHIAYATRKRIDSGLEPAV